MKQPELGQHPAELAGKKTRGRPGLRRLHAKDAAKGRSISEQSISSSARFEDKAWVRSETGWALLKYLVEIHGEIALFNASFCNSCAGDAPWGHRMRSQSQEVEYCPERTNESPSRN